MAKILIVDDEELMIAPYEMVLTRAGHKVIATSHASDGLEIADKEKPDIILLDMLMPEMNGIDFLEILKYKKKIGLYYIIAFSNIENPDLVRAAKKLGAKEYMLKVEYTPHQLAEHIAEIVKTKSKTTAKK